MSFEMIRDRLLRSLRLLAQPASVQISRSRRRGSPEDCGDELRLQYEDTMEGARPFLGRDIEPAQAERLHALTMYFRAMVGSQTSQLWTDRALRHSPEWARVRELAAEALVAFGAWPRRWGKGRRRAIHASAEAAKRVKGS